MRKARRKEWNDKRARRKGIKRAARRIVQKKTRLREKARRQLQQGGGISLPGVMNPLALFRQ